MGKKFCTTDSSKTMNPSQTYRRETDTSFDDTCTDINRILDRAHKVPQTKKIAKTDLNEFSVQVVDLWMILPISMGILCAGSFILWRYYRCLMGEAKKPRPTTELSNIVIQA